MEMPWSSQQQSAKIEALMGDQREIFRREILNEETESSIVKVFDPEQVDVLESSNYDLREDDDIRHVFVAIDPAAGGSQSKFAIVSLAITGRDVPSDENHEQGEGAPVPLEDIVVPPRPLPPRTQTHTRAFCQFLIFPRA